MFHVKHFGVILITEVQDHEKSIKTHIINNHSFACCFFGYNRLEKINERNKYVSEISVLIDYDENKAEDYFNYHKIHPSFEIDRVVAEVNDRNEEILYYDSFFDLIKQPNRFECIVYFFENKEASINDVIVISNKQLLDIEYDAVLMEYLHLDMDGATTRKCVEYSKKYVEAKTEDVIILSNKQLLDMEYDELLLEYLYLDIDGTSIRKCVEYSKKYDEIETEDVVHIVSLGLEEIIPSEQFLSLIYTNFFMPTRVQRYLELYQNNLNYTSRQVVEIVNCDADRQFYTNVEPSDLSKGTLVINNKFNYLESDYVPANLVVVDEKI